MGQIKVTWKKSTIGRNKIQEDNIRSLGLKKLNQTVTVEDNPVTRGMIEKVRHLIAVEEA